MTRPWKRTAKFKKGDVHAPLAEKNPSWEKNIVWAKVKLTSPALEKAPFKILNKEAMLEVINYN